MKTNSCRHSEYLSTQLLNLSTPTTQREDFTILDVAAGEQAVDSAPEAVPGCRFFLSQTISTFILISPRAKIPKYNRVSATYQTTEVF